jgi:uncharacterized phage protein gp47/JayE
MPSPQWLSRDAFTALQVAAIQAAGAATDTPIDASEGSITLAWVEGGDAAALWLQGQTAQTLALTRAATSNKADLDSWFADWFFTRLPAVAATGQVTLSRLQNTTQVVVTPGPVALSTGPGGQQFIITVDTTNGAWNAGLGGYVLAASGASSITVPIAAAVAGTAGNVLANTITSFVAPIVGIDSVTNASPLTNGLNAESDPAFRARFPLYLASLRLGTPEAIQYAVQSIAQNVVCKVLNNETYGGATQYGYVTVVVDNGTGTPPESLLVQANAAVLATVACGAQYSVNAPTVVTANVACTVVSENAGLHAADVAAATAAVEAYIDTLPIGASLPYARLFQIIFDSSANITGVTGLLLNSGTSDLTASAVDVIKAGTVTVS